MMMMMMMMMKRMWIRIRRTFRITIGGTVLSIVLYFAWYHIIYCQLYPLEKVATVFVPVPACPISPVAIEYSPSVNPPPCCCLTRYFPSSWCNKRLTFPFEICFTVLPWCSMCQTKLGTEFLANFLRPTSGLLLSNSAWSNSSSRQFKKGLAHLARCRQWSWFTYFIVCLPSSKGRRKMDAEGWFLAYLSTSLSLKS